MAFLGILLVRDAATVIRPSEKRKECLFVSKDELVIKRPSEKYDS